MEPTPESAATPLCPKCLEPVDALRYYCAACGWDTGQDTPYIEYVNIRWLANGYAALWRKLWFDPKPSWIAKLGYFLFILWTAPVMLVGLPFIWMAKRNATPRA